MTDRKQFEAMLEALINEDQETAKDIFHNIVVAKSREIYEELLESDFDSKEDEEDEQADDKEVDETFADDEEATDDEEGSDDEEGEDDVGGDATDDLIGDVSDEEGSDEEADMGGDEEIEDRVMDLEDALEELKAEFEQLMASDDEGADDMGADDMGGDMGADDMGGDMGADDMEGDILAKEMFEYTEKVALPKHGDNGVNAKSIVAKANNMGGTTANIVKGGESKGAGTKGGLLNPSTKEDNAGNVNVPGAKSATKLSSVSAGHGAEKKGKGETADNKKSIVGSRK
jgi:hypothetical protein